MALSEGTRLGVYEVVGLIGQGGMGEVYQRTGMSASGREPLRRPIFLEPSPFRFARS